MGTTPVAPNSFLRLIARLDRKKIHPWMALRNAVGITLPLALGVHFGYIGTGVVGATGALNVAAGDGVDSYRNRAVRMVAASALCGAAVFLGTLSAHNSVLVAVLRVICAFAAGLVVSLGSAAADIGMVSLVVFIVFSAQPLTAQQALSSGLVAFAGGLLQTALAVASWPVRGLRPERRLISDFYRELARTATLPANPQDPPRATRQSTLAQDALSGLSGEHRREAERHFMLVGEAERIRLALFALNRCLSRISREPSGDPAAAAIRDYLALTNLPLTALAAILRDEPSPQPDPSWAPRGDRIRQTVRDLAADPASPTLAPLLTEARLQMDALAGQLRAALEIATRDVPLRLPAHTPEELRSPWTLQIAGWFATLRANLSLDSSACRHAIRLAVCIAIGDFLANYFSLPRSYWLAMTIALVLKPDFGSTFSRGVLRLAGTYTGLLLATLLFHFASTGPSGQVFWIAILAFLQLSLGRGNYGILSIAISALIVFLFSLGGIAPGDVIMPRAINTTIAGALALLLYWLWPTREKAQAPQALANMLDAYRLYFQAVSSLCLDPQRIPRGDLDRRRTASRRARSNVEASVDRLLAEPYAGPDELRALNAILASSHRFIHAVMALDAGLSASPSSTARAAFQTFAHDLEKVLYFQAARLRGAVLAPESLPDLREDHDQLLRAEQNALLKLETDRMTNSLNTLTRQLFDWVQPAPSQ